MLWRLGLQGLINLQVISEIIDLQVYKDQCPAHKGLLEMDLQILQEMDHLVLMEIHLPHPPVATQLLLPHLLVGMGEGAALGVVEEVGADLHPHHLQVAIQLHHHLVVFLPHF